jgi:hypothetical protein
MNPLFFFLLHLPFPFICQGVCFLPFFCARARNDFLFLRNDQGLVFVIMKGFSI